MYKQIHFLPHNWNMDKQSENTRNKIQFISIILHSGLHTQSIYKYIYIRPTPIANNQYNNISPFELNCCTQLKEEKKQKYMKPVNHSLDQLNNSHKHSHKNKYTQISCQSYDTLLNMLRMD